MVDVRAYTKRDSTQVSAHTRSAPRTAAAGGGAGLLVFLAVLWGMASHNVTVTVPPAGSASPRPASTALAFAVSLQGRG
ncbi:hypothetical protein [Phaeacidiphilus oryzae]|uniref:hypothetical protein n=1 Tax=Phaeacidiphilus oryzae TaxID=348818 RepID=UPI000566B9B4|nr:hypothetical protein [Phaeacidiphilus oryzae]